MQTRPQGITDTDVAAALRAGWGLDVAALEYAPVGFGSHHWLARDGADGRWFVTVDELDQQGRTPDQSYGRLRRAFDTALALRRDAGLDFVVAPLPARDGTPVRRLDEGSSIALFPWVDGEAREFGTALPATERAELIAMLDMLHRAEPPASIAHEPLDQPAARATVDDALTALDQPWSAGPFAAPARQWLCDHADCVRALVGDVVALAARVAARGTPVVVTHGEPHPGNVVRTADGPVLVDWDTVALAPPERDLWFVAGPGLALNDEAVTLYRKAWDLNDLAVYLHDFRAPHGSTEDTEQAWAALASIQLPAPG
jgi:spectinomycin phosphotransferase